MAPAQAPAPAADPVQAALAQAQARRAPVVVDFHAPWCYSCYYMAKNVLTGPEWDAVKRSAVVVELDGDSPEGAHWMKQWNVKALPTYVVLSSSGAELGRRLGEQTRADFYAWLNPTLAQVNTLDTLKARVVEPDDASVAAAREVLAAYHARYDAAGGLGWYLALPPKVRAAVSRDAGAGLWVGRLELQRAAAEKDASACVKAGGAVLAANLGCERAYELDKVLACEGPAGREDLLRSQAELMELLVAKRVLGDASFRCADERSVVLVTADLHKALGDAAAEKSVLERAVTDVKARLGDNFRKDRNLADNLRVYLDRAGDHAQLDAVLTRLIATYPEDYVYAYRAGRTLAARGQHEQAVPFFRQAALRAYGINRLKNAELHATSLHALGKDDEAKAVIAAALQANGPWLPDEAAKLRDLPASWSATPLPIDPPPPPAQTPAPAPEAGATPAT